MCYNDSKANISKGKGNCVMTNGSFEAFFEKYDSNDAIYQKHHKTLLEEDIVEIRKLLNSNITGGEDYEENTVEKDCRDFINTKNTNYKIEQNIKLIISKYVYIRERGVQKYDESKKESYREFLNYYKDIEQVIKNNRHIYPNGKENEFVPLHEFFTYFYNHQKREAKISIINRNKNEKEYAKFIHINNHTFLKTLFEFMYDNKIDVNIPNMLKLLYFCNNFPFFSYENNRLSNYTTYEFFLKEYLPFMEMMIEKIKNDYEKLPVNDKKDNDIPAEKFLKIIEEFNYYSPVHFEIHANDIVELLTSNLYNFYTDEIPLSLIITTFFKEKQYYKQYQKLRERFRENPKTKSSYLPFQCCFPVEKHTYLISNDTYKTGYNFIINSLKTVILKYENNVEIHAYMKTFYKKISPGQNEIVIYPHECI